MDGVAGTTRLASLGAGNEGGKLRELERRRTLERGGKMGRVRRAAEIEAGQGRKQAKRGDDADEQKRQDRSEYSMVGMLHMEDEERQHGDGDCDQRSQ